MSTLRTKQNILAVICIVLALSFCSCMPNLDIVQEVANVADFVLKIGEVTEKAADPNMTDAEKIELANETLFHSKSTLTVESVWDEVQHNEQLAEIGEIKSINIVTLPDPSTIISSLKYDEELGGNTYTTVIEVAINDSIISVEITLLSDDTGFGIYDYILK